MFLKKFEIISVCGTKAQGCVQGAMVELIRHVCFADT